MIFCFHVLYFLIFIDAASSELILKIDLNERTDERTTANFLYLTFVNTTDNEHMLNDDNNITLNINEDTEGNLNKNILNINDDNKENLNRIHQLVKRNPEIDPMSVSFNVDTHTHNSPPHPHMNIPLKQWRGDNSKIKECLDDFKMIKKRTYVSTPKYNFPKKKYYEFETEENIFRRKDTPDPVSQIARETVLFQLISKQNKLIERIAEKTLDTEKRKKRIVRTIFDDILESVEAKHNKTTTRKCNVTTTTEANKLSTILTLVDEKEIRDALKKDPFVSRILRMAAKKRKEYESKREAAAKFLS